MTRTVLKHVDEDTDDKNRTYKR